MFLNNKSVSYIKAAKSKLQYQNGATNQISLGGIFGFYDKFAGRLGIYFPSDRWYASAHMYMLRFCYLSSAPSYVYNII